MNLSKTSCFKFKKTNRIITSIVVLIIITISSFGIIDQKSKHYVNDATGEALGAYATARAINATVAVLESGTVSFDIGLGASAQPLQLLKPVGDMAEEFSEAAKTSFASLLIQEVLINITSTVVFKVLLATFGALLIIAILLQAHTVAVPLFKAFLLLGLARFLIIVILMLNAIASQVFIQNQMARDLNRVQTNQNILSNMTPSSGLSPEERQKTRNELKTLESEKPPLVSQIQNLSGKIAKDQAAVKAAKAPVDAIESKMSFWEKHDPFKKDGLTLADDKKALNQREDTLNADTEKLDEFTHRLNEIDTKTQQDNLRLTGRDKSFLDKTMMGITRAISLKKFLAKSAGFLESMLRLATLFIFQTIILPLIFFFLLLKGFKEIWAVDAMTFLGIRNQNTNTLTDAGAPPSQVK